MTTTHQIRGQVPADSPARALRGRDVHLPAGTLAQLVHRWREMRVARVDPVIVPARYVPWTRIAVALAGAVLAAVATALTAILTGHTTTAWAAAGAMVLLGVSLFPVLTHLEMDA